MVDLTVCTGKGLFQTNVDPNEIDLLRKQPDHVLWFDINDPSNDDLDLLRREFQFHPLALEDVTRQQERPKIVQYDRYYFVVFYCVGTAGKSERLYLKPLYLFVGHNYLVTVHAEPVAPIEETLKRWRAPDSPLSQTVGTLVYALLDALVDDYFPVMDHVAERIESLEQEIFEHFDERSIKRIFVLKNDLFKVRRVLGPERDIVNVLLRRDIPVLSERDIPYLQDVYDHLVRILDTLDMYRDLLSSALDSFLSLQSNRLNQIVKVLTVTSIVLMSMTLVAGIYGMNFQYMPELHWRFGYLWALGLMVGISVGLVVWFRRIKWL